MLVMSNVAYMEEDSNSLTFSLAIAANSDSKENSKRTGENT